METNKLKGGNSDGKTLYDIAKKFDHEGRYNPSDFMKSLQSQFAKGCGIEREHTKDENIAKEITMDHLWEDPNYYDKLEKMEKTFKKEPKEQTMSDASGSFEGSLGMPMVKRKIETIHNSTIQEVKKGEFKEATDSSSSGAYDVAAFAGKGRTNPLKIDGVKSIAKSRAVTDPKFPKWGGPGGVFVKVKEKCKKFPYCNQGDINAIEELREAINESAKKHNLPINVVEEIVLKGIKEIFI